MSDGVRVAIVGVGNCASALVQGVEYYGDATSSEPGLVRPFVGGWAISDIEFSAAFDVDVNKVGLPLTQAIFAQPNNTKTFYRFPEVSGPTVMRGRTLDGLGKYLSEVITEATVPSVDVAKVLRDTDTDVVVNFLPVGSEEATKWYAEQALLAGCAFVNCIPVFLASDKTGYWPNRFRMAGLPIIGDDIKSQVGATIVHRVLTTLFEDRGVKLLRTYQLNFGGNTDFLNMLERERLASKKVSKTGSVQSMLAHPLDPGDIHVGPSDHIPWLDDRKWCYIRMEGETFGGVPLNLELKLEVWDSPNSAGIVIDAVRCARLALDRNIGGPVIEPSAYFMKTPPMQFRDDAALVKLEEWMING